LPYVVVVHKWRHVTVLDGVDVKNFVMAIMKPYLVLSRCVMMEEGLGGVKFFLITFMDHPIGVRHLYAQERAHQQERPSDGRLPCEGVDLQRVPALSSISRLWSAQVIWWCSKPNHPNACCEDCIVNSIMSK